MSPGLKASAVAAGTVTAGGMCWGSTFTNPIVATFPPIVNFDPVLSREIDLITVNYEHATGIRRFYLRRRLAWAERKIPRGHR